MVPNHLAHLLALTAMEPSSSLSAAALQNEQVKVLESVPPVDPEQCSSCVVRGQYTRGHVDGVPVPAYREEPFVRPDSETETYVAIKMNVDTWRWAGIPFYLRTGKRLRKRNTEVVIQFRDPPLALFRRSGASLPQANSLVVGIQPQENICLEFQAKRPGPRIESSPAAMYFDYRLYFGAENRTGYETLLYDAMIGDSSLFKRADLIEAGWAIVQPILDAWTAGRGGPLHLYPAGSDGPAAADELIQRDGRSWRPL
jgi:glucose-6-phosphate 1-dehydrogenase